MLSTIITADLNNIGSIAVLTPRHTEIYSMLRNIYRMFVVVGLVLAAAACRSDHSTPDFESTFEDATVALEANRVEQSQELADRLRDLTLLSLIHI